MHNGRKPDLELGGLAGEPFTIMLPEYTFTLPHDTPLSALIGASRALVTIGAIAQGEKEAALADIQHSENELWTVVEDVMKHADPVPSKPVRELLSTPDAIRLINFLAAQFTEAQNSTPLSVSPMPSAEPSASASS